MLRWVVRLILAVSLAVGLGYLPYRAYGPGGVGRALRLERELERLAGGNVGIQQENTRLRRKIARLKRRRYDVERVARDELGLVRAGDLVFLFEKSAPARRPDRPESVR